MSKGRREESDGIADTERLSSQFSAVHSAEALESTDEEMEALEHALLMRSWRILGSFIEAEATPSVVIEAQLSLFFLYVLLFRTSFPLRFRRDECFVNPWSSSHLRT